MQINSILNFYSKFLRLTSCLCLLALAEVSGTKLHEGGESREPRSTPSLRGNVTIFTIKCEVNSKFRDALFGQRTFSLIILLLLSQTLILNEQWILSKVFFFSPCIYWDHHMLFFLFYSVNLVNYHKNSCTFSSLEWTLLGHATTSFLYFWVLCSHFERLPLWLCQWVNDLLSSVLVTSVFWKQAFTSFNHRFSGCVCEVGIIFHYIFIEISVKSHGPSIFFVRRFCLQVPYV